MKKIILSSLIIFTIVFLSACKDLEEIKFTNVSNGHLNVIVDQSNAYNPTFQSVYEKLRENNEETIINKLVSFVKNEEVNIENIELIELYDEILIDLFKEKVVDNKDYFTNSKFDEDKASTLLKSKGFNIICGGETSYDVGYDLNCNFDSYIESVLIPMANEIILTVKFISTQRVNMIESYKVREIQYIKFDSNLKGSKVDTFNFIKEIVNDLDSSYFEDFKAVEAVFKNNELIELYEDFTKITSPTSSTYMEALTKYSKCGDRLCDVFDGYQYRIDEINSNSIIDSLIINKDYKDFSQNILTSLFSDDFGDKLVEINGEKYLTSHLSNKDDLKKSDSILFDSSTNQFYLIKVNVLDIENVERDLYKAAYNLNEMVSFKTVMAHFLKNYEVESYETILDESLQRLFG